MFGGSGMVTQMSGAGTHPLDGKKGISAVRDRNFKFG